MEQNVTQVHNTSANELVNSILEGVEQKFNAFEKKLSNKEKPEYLSRKDVSKLLNVSLVTVSTWSKKGVLNPLKIGGKIRFIRKEIEETLQKQSNS